MTNSKKHNILFLWATECQTRKFHERPLGGLWVVLHSEWKWIANTKIRIPSYTIVCKYFFWSHAVRQTF